MWETLTNKSRLLPADTAPWGTVRNTPESGMARRAPEQVTEAQVVNLGSHLLAEHWEDPDDAVAVASGGGGGGVGKLGSGVEVMAKVGFSPLSNVPPTEGLE